jgi:hypothetical protein
MRALITLIPRNALVDFSHVWDVRRKVGHMPNPVVWGSIELLHNVIRTQNHLAALPLNEGGRLLSKVIYQAKVKLHGVNCGIQITDEGVFYQSRTTMLTPEADLKGFAKWASFYDFGSLPRGTVVYGEWTGPGVEKGIATAKLTNKVFAVFALQVQDKMVYAPSQLQELLGAIQAPRTLHFTLVWQFYRSKFRRA